MQGLTLILRRMLDTNSESVQLQTDYPPRFKRRNGDPFHGQSPLDADTLVRMAEHLLKPAEMLQLNRDGRIAAQHTIPGLGVFDFVVKRVNSNFALAFRLEDGMDEQVDLSMAVDTSMGVLPRPFDTIPGRIEPLPGGFEVEERSFTGLLKAVLKFQVSDLVVSANRPARVRIGGQYHQVNWAVFDSAGIMSVLQPMMTADRHALFEEKGNLDTAFEIKDDLGRLRRFRVNLFRHIDGIAAAWRPIWDKIPDLEELRLPSQLLKLSQLPYGLILITGPTGSGKSTTLSAIIQHINQTYRRHIITLEDPIEYRFRDAQSVIHQREIGLHVDNFSTGLKSALREAPDVILVGEMRDQQTIAAALTAAETGHLVLSTLHSGHSAQAIDRIIDVFPEHQQQQVRTQLADVLRAVVTQRLLPAINSKKRIPAVELVLATYAVSNTIREGRTHQLMSLIQSGSQNGMIPFDLSLAKLVGQGLIESRVAEQCARDKSFFESLVKRNTSY